jgi:hypothetical protein
LVGEDAIAFTDIEKRCKVRRIPAKTRHHRPQPSRVPPRQRRTLVRRQVDVRYDLWRESFPGRREPGYLPPALRNPPPHQPRNQPIGKNRGAVGELSGRGPYATTSQS